MRARRAALVRALGDPVRTSVAADRIEAVAANRLPIDAIETLPAEIASTTIDAARAVISSIQAHMGAEAARSAHEMGADAYATGNHVVLGDNPDLFTTAHEAAHVIQQRAGVHCKGGVGEANDRYERHADAVAQLVVQGKSAEDLLDRDVGTSHERGGSQASPAPAHGAAPAGTPIVQRHHDPKWARATLPLASSASRLGGASKASKASALPLSGLSATPLPSQQLRGGSSALISSTPAKPRTYLVGRQERPFSAAQHGPIGGPRIPGAISPLIVPGTLPPSAARTGLRSITTKKDAPEVRASGSAPSKQQENDETPEPRIPRQQGGERNRGEVEGRKGGGPREAANWKAIEPLLGKLAPDEEPAGYRYYEVRGRKHIKRKEKNEAAFARLYIDEDGRLQAWPPSNNGISKPGDLARNLGPRPDRHQAHHVIPVEIVRRHPLFKVERDAAKRERNSGYNPDDASNGVWLPNHADARPDGSTEPVHCGPHPDYTRRVEPIVDRLYAGLLERFGTADQIPHAEMLGEIRQLDVRARAILETYRNRKLE